MESQNPNIFSSLVDTLFSCFLLCILISGVFIYAIYASNTRARHARQARLRAMDLADIDSMDGIAFEHYVAELLRHEGYTDVYVSRASGDFGVDIVACREDKRYAIQVKRHRGTVSRRAVSDAVAGMSHYRCNASMVITNSFLSVQSMAFASKLGCEIVNRDGLGEWILRYQSSGTLPSTAFPVNSQPQSSLNSRSTRTEQSTIGSSTNAQSEACNTLVTQGATEREPESQIPIWSDIPSDVLCAIKADAQKNYPRDFKTQAYIVESNVEAYRNIQTLRYSTVPSSVIEEMKRRVQTDYPTDYRTQLYVLEKDAKAFLRLDRMTGYNVPQDVLQEIKDDAARDYPGDYSTQLYVIGGQVRAYRTLHGA